MIDASGAWVAPGFVDLHVHLREPGQEYKEDIASGGRAAVAGGFSAVVCMANTQPVNDDPSVTEYILDRARQESPARVYPVGAATRGLGGEVMTEMVALVDAGCVALSDDGKTIMDTGVMRRILEYSQLARVAIITHAEDRTLVREGVVNEGPVSTRLGLPGNPATAEVIHVARDILLAQLTGAHLHVAHVSTAGAVDLIRQARERGIHVTAEVTPHHLALTDESTLGYDTNTKMAPPLRSAQDVAACRAGLADGTIDAIATDHAPHAVHEKDVEFTAAPPGVIGLETAVPVTLDLVRANEIAPLEWVRRLVDESRPHHPPRRRLARGGRARRHRADRSRAALGLRPGEGLLEEPQLAVGGARDDRPRDRDAGGRRAGLGRRTRSAAAVSARTAPASPRRSRSRTAPSTAAPPSARRASRQARSASTPA